MLTIRVINTDEEFAKLEPEWRELILQTPESTYFQTWEFTSNRWKHFQEGRRLWILTARDEDERLVGVAPLAIGRGRTGPIRVQRLEFICRVEIPFRFERYYLDGEDLDIIAHPDFRDAVAAMFSLKIDQNPAGWDVVDLAWLSSNSPLRRHIERTRSLTVERRESRARAVLPDEWETYDKSILDRGLSKQNRYKQRRLERDFPGAVEYRMVSERDDVAPAVENLEDLKFIQFASKGSEASADDPHARQHRNFARDFALDAFDQGWLRFYQLTVDGEVVAANFGIAIHGVYYLLNKGFNPEWKKHSPGYVLQAHEIRCAIEEGLREYDLGQGLISDKLLWTQAERADFRLLYGCSLSGHTYVAEEAIWTAARTRLPEFIRSVLPESSYERVKRAIKGRARTLTPESVVSDESSVA